MRRSTVIALAAAAVIVAAVIITVFVVRSANPLPSLPEGVPVEPDSALAADSHVLDTGGDLVLVEFLDFECPSCAAFQPHVAALREEFAGELTYAVRYFPLPNHPNSVSAALAAEAAARQDRLEGMADLLFERQADWAGAPSSQLPLFREYAAELELDLDRFDADVVDPAVLDRIAADARAGQALGVHSTPTFFLDDRMLQLRSLGELREVVAAAL
jgi:protein-disulfide isomerase